MQNIKKIYRSNYAGESIITELVLSNNEWQPTTEYIPNSVFNTHTSTQAVAIAGGPSKDDFDLRHIARHRGGLFAENKLQSYGCNLLYRKFSPDFLVAAGDEKVATIVESGYTTDHIVYTNAQYIVQYPGKFYLVPQNLTLDTGALAIYLAAFDGHKKVFLLGYDKYTDDTENTFWVKALLSVVTTYGDVDFVRVMPTSDYSCAISLMSQPNFRQISYRDFVLEADIG